jgi:hypothetical protein
MNEYGIFGGMIQREENRRTGTKSCPNATLSTTNPTRTGQGINPHLRDEKSATKRPNNGTARKFLLRQSLSIGLGFL